MAKQSPVPHSFNAQLKHAVKQRDEQQPHTAGKLAHHVRRSMLLAVHSPPAAGEIIVWLARASRRCTWLLDQAHLSKACGLRGQGCSSFLTKASKHELCMHGEVQAPTIPSVRCVTQKRARSPGSPYVAIKLQASHFLLVKHTCMSRSGCVKQQTFSWRLTHVPTAQIRILKAPFSRTMPSSLCLAHICPLPPA